ncbi:MAG: GntR family transcriptional regulator, partial [Deltaproteobacteria bacterium]|nr:GntR family transcriptional regulator [Deltaproteobacteria bacterium]
APVRNALIRLSQEGLVIPAAQSGYLIAPLTLKDIEEIFELRIFLERESARKAADNITPSQIQELKSFSSIGHVPGDPSTEIQFIQANRNFHIGIAKASGNAKLANMIRNLFDEFTRITRLVVHVTSEEGKWPQGHRETLRYIIEGDGESAGKTMVKEIEAGKEKAMMALIRSPSIINVNLASNIL